MSETLSDFTPVNIEQWKVRLEKELKPPFQIENLQWKVSDLVSLPPLSGPESHDLQYLKNFHQAWKASMPAARARISVGTHAMLSQSEEKWRKAEAYGFQSWFGPSPLSAGSAALPLSDRSKGHEPDPVLDGLAMGKWQAKGQETPSEWHIHGHDIQEAGGDMVQELASLLLVSDYYLDSAGAWPKMVWHLGTGTSFWMELVKCRVARLLWMNFAAFHQKDFKNFQLTAKTSTLHWSAADVDTNLIRHAAEVMAVLMGGVDEVRILPHTLDPEKALEATRLATNLALLCFEESHLDDHFDPASGSFWVENATDALAAAAWQKFTSWQEEGLENLVRSGRWVGEIGDSANKLKAELQSGSKIQIGDNAYVSDMAQKSPDWPDGHIFSDADMLALRPFRLHT